MNAPKVRDSKWLRVLGGPILSLIAFIGMFFLDPLNFGGLEPVAAMPAFLLSIVILLISEGVNTSNEIRKASIYSDRIYEAVKDNLHITKLGSPEKSFQYVISRLPSLKEVKNTSLNLCDEVERADERFYETEEYKKSCNEIALYTSQNVLWKDIGDNIGVERLRNIFQKSSTLSNNTSNYKYKLISHQEPQINFLIMEYVDGTKEVLFNWDYRGIGQDPMVLISRDSKIIEMFTIHFSHLWRHASNDHDISATRSTSIK